MVIPLHDDNPLRNIHYPYVNWGLIALCVLIHVFVGSEFFLTAEKSVQANFAFGIIPAVFNHLADLPEQWQRIPDVLTPFTYMFLHADWLHLMGNMLFLWVFGDNIEDVLGSKRYAVFYIACGVTAALVFAWLGPRASEAPLIGASGAISGVIAAYFLLFPKAKVWILLFWRIPIKIAAWMALGLWIIIQFWQVFTAGQADSTAWLAHVGGLIAGTVFILAYRRGRVFQS